MPRGRPRKILSSVTNEEEELEGLESLQMTVAQIIQETVCGISGCDAKWHLEDAKVVVQKMKLLDLIRER